MDDEEETFLKIKDVPDDRKLNKLDIEALNKNEIRKKNKIFNVYHVRALVCGSSGSGKTTYILNYIFQNINNYNLILYCAPTETLESGMIRTILNNKSLNDKYFKNKLFILNIRKDKLPTIKELQTINKNKKIMLVLDDFINVLTSKEDRQQINVYLTQSSRANCDLFLLVQTYNNISPSIATNVNVLIFQE